jgi:hypothetical protein
MTKLIYSAIASLDGYVADEEGNFDWAVPDEEVHAFINDLARPVGPGLWAFCVNFSCTQESEVQGGPLRGRKRNAHHGVPCEECVPALVEGAFFLLSASSQHQRDTEAVHSPQLTAVELGYQGGPA